MGSILAIDYGLKHIGFAVSDPDRKFAFGLGVVENKKFDFVLSHIKKLSYEKEIDLIIVGLPLNMDGSSGKMVKIVQEFVNKLKKEINVSVEMVDERLSSFIAGENLKEGLISSKKSKDFVDMESARVIIEEYIEKTKHSS